MSDIGIFGLVLFHEKQYALPQVSFGGDTYTFLNGIGYGIDGYCCEVGDAMMACYLGVSQTCLLYRLDRLNMVDHKPFKEYDLLTASFFTWR